MHDYIRALIGWCDSDPGFFLFYENIYRGDSYTYHSRGSFISEESRHNGYLFRLYRRHKQEQIAFVANDELISLAGCDTDDSIDQIESFISYALHEDPNYLFRLL